MSFLDNLENNLKSMESREERTADPGKEQRYKESERAHALAAAPYSEQLRKGQFTSDLMTEATRIAHGYRTKVYMTWMENTLRLEARSHRLELKPTPDGVIAQYYIDREPTGTEKVDLNGDPKAFAAKWLSQVGPRPQVQPVESE